ncbi:GTP-binding protein HflX [Halothece sp. PCC 7418]|uniref:GTPase HflX n=1 Tax=Halothece sp. (strain PCC 7418) TaxID=65093 RepID=UPI0002A0810A|nr:GTP-binding protein HflX [Halothece sp. PCC 7418]
MSIETIHGNLKGLKSSQLKQLQRLYHQRQPRDRATTPEFAQRVAAISTDINQPVSAYINRRGQVIRVGVGSPRETQIPPLELPRYGAKRLSGIRCVTTALKSDPPKKPSLTAMVLQRLDVLVTLTLTGQGFQRRGGGATGYVESAYLAHLAPESDPNREQGLYWTVSPPLSLDVVTQQDFLDLVEGLEAEFEREYVAQQVDISHQRVVVVGLMTADLDHQQFADGLAEVTRLVDTAGGEVLQTITQRRSRPHPQTVIGAGKVQEIAIAVQTLGASLVAFDQDLTPAQARNLEQEIGVRVIDRTELILDIFAQRARSRAGKLQVELAQLEYLLPRLVGRGEAMSRLGGGIGTRGPGETKLETERRRIQKRVSRLQQEVNQLQSHRSRMRQQRQKQEVPTIAVVGYTNAGKSTLLNNLTHAEIYAEDQLFATLDPTTRRLNVPCQGEMKTILLTDTVGFIKELPPALIDAFRATLEEVSEADAMLHVVDLSHSAWESQIESVSKILEAMPIMPPESLLVFNKIDQVDSETLSYAKEHFPEAVYISAEKRLGLETLREKMGEMIINA